MSKPPHQFEPRTEILPAAQRRLWPELIHTPPHFTLYGGTALALRLAHRKSVDFDFFSTKPISGMKLLDEVPYLAQAQVRQLDANTLDCSVKRSGIVRLSYFGALSIGQVDPDEVAVGPMIKVASLRDIAGTKLAVVTQRAELKDYLDIHALLTRARLPLAEMLGCASVLYGRSFNPLIALKSLAYHGDPGLKGLTSGMKKDLLAAIRATDPTRLPSIKAHRRRKARA